MYLNISVHKTYIEEWLKPILQKIGKIMSLKNIVNTFFNEFDNSMEIFKRTSFIYCEIEGEHILIKNFETNNLIYEITNIYHEILKDGMKISELNALTIINKYFGEEN